MRRSPKESGYMVWSRFEFNRRGFNSLTLTVKQIRHSTGQ